MPEAWICDALRTPIGRYGGALSSVRTDDLGAIPLRALLERNESLPADAIDDVIYGCANQAGEDNRNVARMSSLLAGLPESVPGATVNRLCGSGMNALGNAAHAIKAGDASVVIAGGVESMSRAPFVLAKSTTAFGRNAGRAVWYRFDGLDSRKRGGRLRRLTGRPGPICLAQPATGDGWHFEWTIVGRNYASDGAAAAG
jgi:acetyl-CoA acetyltransferase